MCLSSTEFEIFSICRMACIVPFTHFIVTLATSALADHMIRRGTKVILVRKMMWGIGKDSSFKLLDPFIYINHNYLIRNSLFYFHYCCLVSRGDFCRCDWLFCWIYKLPPGGSGGDSVVFVGRCNRIF